MATSIEKLEEGMLMHVICDGIPDGSAAIGKVEGMAVQGFNSELLTIVIHLRKP